MKAWWVVAAQRAIRDKDFEQASSSLPRAERFSRYWYSSRVLMLLWLALSIWQIGAYPVADGNAEARGLLMGFRLATAIEDGVALGTPFLYGVPPLSYLLTTLGAHMLPVGEFMWRLPYALVGAAHMPLLLFLTRKVFGQRAAVFAGVLLLSTGLFAINRLATGASVFMAFELAGVVFLLKYLDDASRRWLLFSMLAFVGGALTISAGAAFLVTTLAIAWFVHRNRRDVAFAAATGTGLLAGYFMLAAGVSVAYSRLSLVEPSGLGIDGGWTFELHPGGFVDSWIVYAGVPALALVLVGVAEAVIHRDQHRTAVLALPGMAFAFALPWVVMEPSGVTPVLALPIMVAVAGYGWAQVTRQLQSVAAQGMVAMSVVSIAMAGVVWQQAVFNPTAGFTGALSGLREYALAISAGPGLFADDGYGLKAVSQVLREETDPGDRIFVRDADMAAAISLYSARSTRALDFEDFNKDISFLDGSFLVIRGEDETFNAGLSGTTTVVANHRVFADDRVLYQVIEFGSSGEQFHTPVWWRAEPYTRQFSREYRDFRDFLVPLRATNEAAPSAGS